MARAGRGKRPGMSKTPLSDYGKALLRISKQEKQIGALTNRCDLAERQARSLTLELQAARRQIAELKSLTARLPGSR